MGSTVKEDSPAALRAMLAELEADYKDKSAEAAAFEAEIRSLQRKLAKREAEIMRQERELHKLRVRRNTAHIYSISIK